jgi:hypothetical protein
MLTAIAAAKARIVEMLRAWNGLDDDIDAPSDPKGVKRR